MNNRKLIIIGRLLTGLFIPVGLLVSFLIWLIHWGCGWYFPFIPIMVANIFLYAFFTTSAYFSSDFIEEEIDIIDHLIDE